MPTVQQRLKSQLGNTHMVQAFPLVTGTFERGHMAHVQGLYSGLTFSTGVPAEPEVFTAIWRPVIRGRRR